MKQLIIIAGGNGSGKSTLAKTLIPELGIDFVNADDIAKELNPQNPDEAKIQAGRIFFGKIEMLIEEGKSLVLESTLSGRYLISLIMRMKKYGYGIRIVYVYLDNVEEAIHRIRVRVKKGGHHIKDNDVCRRFIRSKSLFWHTYKRLADEWELYYNGSDSFIEIAYSEYDEYTVVNEELMNLFLEDIR